MQPWIMHNWPEWQNQFQILLATLGQIDDSQRVIHFLDCLGPDGLAIVLKLFPQLVNIHLTADKSVTFAEVWWQFNEHCWTRYQTQTGPRNDLLEDRKRLQEICDEAVEKAEYDNLLKLIPILSLCELDSVTQQVPILKRVVYNHRKLFGEQIEPCCLKNLTIGYSKHSLEIHSLRLKSLPESDANKVLSLFQGIKHFGMENMTITEDGNWLPRGLTELTLIDCKIDSVPMLRWVQILKTTLRRLHMDNFDDKFYYYSPNQEVRFLRWLDHLKNLSSLTFKSKMRALLLSNADNLEFLTVISGDKHCLNAPKLKHLYCDASDSSLLDLWPIPTLKCPTLEFLALKNWDSFRYVQQYDLPILKEMEILFEAGPIYKAEIEKGQTTVRVEYNEIPDPPEEPNLIFEMLNYDCLLQIISHLSKREWMTFGRLHENAEMVVATYKYHRVTLSRSDFIETGMYADDQDHFQRVSKFVEILSIDTKSDQECTDWRHFISAFENSRTLTLVNISPDLFDVLPFRLDKLVVCNPIYDDPKSTEYMRKLNATLLSLEITEWESRPKDQNQWEWLSEIEKLRELSIGITIPSDISAALLERSLLSLECLKICFVILEDGWTPYESTILVMSKLENVTDLDVEMDQTDYWQQGFDIFEDVLWSIGDNLDKLKLVVDGSGDQDSYVDLLDKVYAPNLSHLIVVGSWELPIETIFDLTMKTVRILEFLDGEARGISRVWNTLGDGSFSDLIEIIESLPNLEEIRYPYFISTFGMEKRLRQYFKEAKRPFRIDAVQF